MTRFAPFALAVVAALPPGPRDGPRPAGRTMAVTVDDLPAMPSADLGEMRRITDGVLAALRRHRATAVGFVNEDKLEPTVERGARLARHTPDEYVGPRGPSWLHRLRMAKGLPVRLDLEPDPPAWVLDLYRKAQER